MKKDLRTVDTLHLMERRSEMKANELKEGDEVITISNMKFEGQTIPKGTKGKVLFKELAFAGSGAHVFDIRFEVLGRFDFYSESLRYIKKINP